MKKYISFSLLLFATFIFVGCEKNDGATKKDIAIDEVPQPAVVINGGSAAIDLTNLPSFLGRFDVKLLYPNGIKPAKFDVVARKNGSNASAKVFQAGVTTYPSTITVTAAQIATLFGTAILLGDSYDFGVDIYTTNGKKYEAFPTVGVAYGSTGVANQPGFSEFVRYGAICAYNPDIYQGNFVVIRDDFEDLLPGDIVTLTKIDATHFSYIYPSGINPIPIIVTVNPLNNTVTIAKQRFGTAFTWQPAYTNPNAEAPLNANTSFVSPCAQEWQAGITYTVDQGTFGPGYVLRMRKQ